MTKLAHAVTEPTKESLQENSRDSEALHLKKKQEDKIRMQLDQFAKELSQARRRRENH